MVTEQLEGNDPPISMMNENPSFENLEVGWYTRPYSFSHSHGSVENGNILLLEGPIFDFHEYGRKCSTKL